MKAENLTYFIGADHKAIHKYSQKFPIVSQIPMYLMQYVFLSLSLSLSLSCI